MAALQKQDVSAQINDSPGYRWIHGLSYRGDGVTDRYTRDQCKLDLYVPGDRTGFTTVVWFHGGGMKEGERYVPEELQNQGLAVAAVSYRMNPKVAAPAYIEDAAAATAWVFEHIEEFGGSSERIIIAGASAGAYLANLIFLDPQWLAPYDIHPNQSLGLGSISGQAITHFTIREERGLRHDQPLADDLAPLYHVRGDAPPILLITGDRELELFGRYEENAFFKRVLNVAGHPDVELHEIQGKDHGGTEAAAHPLFLRWIRRLCD